MSERPMGEDSEGMSLYNLLKSLIPAYEGMTKTTDIERLSMSDTSLLKTPLFDLHLELGAKMVPFAGYEMPVQYPVGLMKEHQHTREQAGLFDVSHMGQVVVRGEKVAEELEKLIPVDLAALGENKQSYGVFTNEQGGILDDLIACRWADDAFFLVVNAACKADDIAHLKNHLQGCELEVLEDRALLALQGPAAKTVMAELAPAVTDLVFMSGTRVEVNGVDCYVTRSGYTGEDGFEISVPSSQCEQLARKLLSFEQVEPIGLGARDSLRLEAGLCLYGHDMNAEISPVEASLLWSISKSRRADGSRAGGFLGAETVLAQIADGVGKKRVGFAVEGRGPVREGSEIVDTEGNEIGVVTSGTFGPTKGEPVAMGYVAAEFAKVGTEVTALVRGKPRKLTVSKMPFVSQNYYRG